MPQETTIRPINLKLLEIQTTFRGTKYIVHNLHNDNSKTFNSIERMINYHSPFTKFISIKKSRLVDKTQSLQTNRIVYHDNIMFTLKKMSIQDEYINYYATYDIDTVLTNISELTNAGTQIYYFPCYIKHRVIDIISRTNGTPIVTQPIEQVERINYNLIYHYHGGPRDCNFHTHQEDNDNEKRFFGIELEVDGSRDNNASREKKHKLATRLNDLLNEGIYNQLVKFEEDGSLGQFGVEIITQPMTMKYIMNNKEKFTEAMRMIEELNYCSHDSGRCGMHIHVSKEALNDTIIDNLYLMFENFRNELVAFSRRTQNGMRWCRFMTDDSYNPERMDEEYIKHHKPTGNDHQSAINMGNRNTIEFRIFRGTTKMRTFLANIQLIDNMIDIASKENIEGITWEQIINLKPEYEELIKYNEIRAIVSKHQLNKNISKIEITQRPVILVRPFQLSLEGDN